MVETENTTVKSSADTQSEVKTSVTKEPEPVTTEDLMDEVDPMRVVIDAMKEAEDAVSQAVNDMARQINFDTE